MMVRLLRRAIRVEPVKYCPVLVEGWNLKRKNRKIGVSEWGWCGEDRDL